jgi:hypothetical protein
MNFENNGTFGRHIRTPVKDFVSLGMVFTENKFEFDSKVFKGDIFTYQGLLKEAQKLGADAIINVVIDKKIDLVTYGMNTTRRETWYGSALAIKYTDTLKFSETEQVYLNDVSAVQTGDSTVSDEQPVEGNWLQRRLMTGKN